MIRSKQVPGNRLCVVLLCLTIWLASQTTPLVAQSEVDLPPGFVLEAVVNKLDGPTAFAQSPDGRFYITQKAGAVRVFHNGQLLRENFIDLSAEVNQTFNRGLVGIALHPDFPRTPYVYLAYVYQPPEARNHKENGARTSRVVRVSADPNNLNKALPNSTQVILGANGTFALIGNPDKSDSPPFTCRDAAGGPVRDCVPVEGTAHQIDMLRFGSDGALYVGVGDGGEHGAAGLRAQDINSLSGKILRIDPLTGVGLRNNPFYNGDSDSNRAKVFMLGLRNPFRFAFHPLSGDLVIGDVGASSWEEVNRGRRGANFGWPCFEGTAVAGTTPPCDHLTAAPQSVVAPLYVFPHTEGRVAIIGGDFYTGSLFPVPLRNAYFFGEYNVGTIWVMTFAQDRVAVQNFARQLSGLVQISAGADGNLYVLSIRAGTLYRIRYTGE